MQSFIVAVTPALPQEERGSPIPWVSVGCIILALLMFAFAKWYTRKYPPTSKKGK